MIDFLELIKRIQSKNTAETFDRATDSLEALRDFLAAALGFGPSVSLWMFGHCIAGMAASLTDIYLDNLGTELPDDVFNNEFYVTVIHNADVPGTAPEGEYRQIANYISATQHITTDAFSAVVEENDLIIILHKSLINMDVIAQGTFTLSDLVQPEDNTRTEAGDHFKGCLLMPTEGAAAWEPRLITAYTGAGGIFDLDPGNPFTALPGLVDYVILKHQEQFVPLVNGTENRLPADVIGHKASTPIFAPDNISDHVRYLKGLLSGQGLCYKGTVTNFVNATQFASSDLIGFGGQAFPRDYFIFVFHDAGLAGNLPQGEFRVVNTYTSATGGFTHEAFTANLANGDEVLIIHQSVMFPQIVAKGMFTFSSATVPADTVLGALYGNDYWDGCDLMPISGVAKFQPRKILIFATGTGVFTMNNPFTVAPAVNDRYLILKNTVDPVIGVDSVANVAMFHVIGNKADTAIFVADNVSSVMRYLKGLMAQLGLATTGATFSYLDAGGEQTIFTFTPTRDSIIHTIWLDLFTLTQNSTIRLKHQIDGANYRTFETFNWTTGMDDGVYFRNIAVMAARPIQVTMQETADEGAARAIPYYYVCEERA